MSDRLSLFSLGVLKLPVVRPSEIYRTIVKGRTRLYFDHNVWIDLADRETTLAEDAFEAARLAVNAGLLVCPVSYPAITELLKQGKNTSSMRQAHVMDALCAGVSVRAERHIVDTEVRFAHAYLCDGRVITTHEDMFTAVACFLGDGELEFPEGWTTMSAAEMTNLVRRNLPTVTWLLEHLPVNDFQERHLAGDKRYVERVKTLNSDLADFTDASGKLNARRLRLEEHTYVLNNYILPRLPRLIGLDGMMVGLSKLKRRRLKPGPNTLARIIDAMPSTSLSCELHVQRRLAGRAPRSQDRFDQEHAVLGVAYCDAFGSSDGELLDLLRKAKASEKYQTKLLRGLGGIRDFVSSLLDSVTVKV